MTKQTTIVVTGALRVKYSNRPAWANSVDQDQIPCNKWNLIRVLIKKYLRHINR